MSSTPAQVVDAAAAATPAAKPASTLFGSTGDSPSYVHFGVGAPDAALLAEASGLLQAAATAPLDAGFLQYGPTCGDDAFRAALAGWLTAEYGGAAVEPGALCATAGATSGLTLLASAFFSRGDTVFVEDPVYFLALDVFAELGLHVVPIRTDRGGMDLAHLQTELLILGETLKQPDAQRPAGPYRAMLYTIPTFHNPTGGSLSEERRRRLVHLTAKESVLTVCDDVYQLLPFPAAVEQGAVPPRLLSYDTAGTGHVVSNCSFSKLFAPGIRLGWMETHKGPVRDALQSSGILVSGGCMNHVACGWMLRLLESGEFAAYVAKLRLTYAERCAALLGVLREKLPNTVELFVEPQGGYFLWLTLPMPAEPALALARKEGVDAQLGSKFSATKAFGNSMRLSFAHYPSEQLVAGAEILCSSINSLLTKRKEAKSD